MQESINLTVTPVTYEEAVKILNSDISTLKHAVGRGALTKLPRIGMHTKLIKEQVNLFVGKRLSLSELNTQENILWKQYKEIASNYGNDKYQLTPATLDNASFIMLNQKIDALVALQKETNKMLAMVHL